MRIATWNVERLKHVKKLNAIEQAIRDASADILVLTETDDRLALDYPYICSSLLLQKADSRLYGATEQRVSIYSRYPYVRRFDTYDPYTAACVEVKTEKGSLLVYGTIMGIFGNREKSFLPDIQKQMEDLQKLSAQGYRLCVAGDYNLSFCDGYYYTKQGREKVMEAFEEYGIDILTRDIPECIDHIAVTNGFVKKVLSISEWNLDKTLSDHKGIVVEMEVLPW